MFPKFDETFKILQEEDKKIKENSDKLWAEVNKGLKPVVLDTCVMCGIKLDPQDKDGECASCYYGEDFLHDYDVEKIMSE